MRRAALLRTALLPVLVLPLAACITTLDSRKATDTARGQRYSLPQPVLRVVPQSDGTMSVDVLYLPDPNNTYTVTAQSILGNYTLDVKTKEGLLDTVSFNSDNTAIAEQAVNSAAAIEKARIEAAAKDRDDAAKAAQDSAKALAEASLNVATAQAKLTALNQQKDHVDGKDIASAEVDLAVAKAKLNALENQNSAMNSMNKAPDKAKFASVAGPIFFSMVPGPRGRVDLIASDPQLRVDTNVVAGPQTGPDTFSYDVQGSSRLRRSNGEYLLRLVPSSPLKAVMPDRMEVTREGRKINSNEVTAEIALVGKERLVLVHFPSAMAPGRYSLSLPVTTAKGARQRPASVDFEIPAR